MPKRRAAVGSGMGNAAKVTSPSNASAPKGTYLRGGLESIPMRPDVTNHPEDELSDPHLIDSADSKFKQRLQYHR